jgi:hypothetical protein
VKTPDYFEPFKGWKGLKAESDGSLRSPMGDEWPAGRPFQAQCNRSEEHVPPADRCSCGIYAVTSFEELKRNSYNWQKPGDLDWNTWVIAEVNLWGAIRRGTIGFRAQYGYPRKIYVPANKLELGSAIRDRYRCQLGVIDRFTGERR